MHLPGAAFLLYESLACVLVASIWRGVKHVSNLHNLLTRMTICACRTRMHTATMPRKLYAASKPCKTLQPSTSSKTFLSCIMMTISLPRRQYAFFSCHLALPLEKCDAQSSSRNLSNGHAVSSFVSLQGLSQSEGQKTCSDDIPKGQIGAMSAPKSNEQLLLFCM